MKRITILLITLGISAWPPTIHPDEKQNDPEKICQEAKSQLKNMKKEMDQIISERESLDQKLLQVRNRFENYQNQLSGMSHCSQGNVSNTPACNQTLEGLQISGKEMTEIQKQKARLAPKKLALENQMFKPQGQLKTYACD